MLAFWLITAFLTLPALMFVGFLFILVLPFIAVPLFTVLPCLILTYALIFVRSAPRR